MLNSVRTRLTFWYTGVLALVLVIFCASIYFLLSSKLHKRLDADVRTTVDGIARLLIYELAEGETEAQAVHSALTEHYFPNQAAAIFDAQGSLLSEKLLANDHRAELPVGVSAISKTNQFFTLPTKGKDEDGSIRVAMQRVKFAGTGKSYVVVASQPMNLMSEELEILREILLAAVPIALLLAGLSGWFLARKSLSPVVEMTESARRIGAENLDEQLPVANPRDELGQLAATFNEMLERLRASFSTQRHFMADASHELRTPLSVIRTAATVTLEKPQRDESEYREALAMIDRQAIRLARIVEDMFTLARADAGKRELKLRDFYLDELVVETSNAAAVLAERKGVAVECSTDHEAPYRGDEDLLRQMMLNLLDNAIKFTPSGGKVCLRLSQNDSRQVITVEDSGRGIPAEAQPHVFERFYRADSARTRSEQANGSGAGLGLSIARWIAEAHNGSLNLVHSDDTGSLFSISLPLNA